ncbi:calcium/sodium antiporter [Serratia odorifera]|jgi:cation:H+ antiporter|uniref:K+-dependent Na+/Ca+ exchanger family protein n=2 Tax=Serratia odorifera TaxID=618 RepID=D4E183_SEROD|nr:calcium/sodium antiporter [Serratia odorifera]EFE96428.1 K+-dependent Na+/Ca+ exchanger family protein [Serratia odorifera DSM 4582]MBJ2067170.1 calcium/sodium antiporter [Serratia odorifera]PNK91076.1 calcium/sodium antiporter [Serratia odorifera]RII72104.1 calcium/sodium antiporter [Serratia odorifera]VDZ57078.1 Inner membrane protein yrbG [Serratia odorifera]
MFLAIALLIVGLFLLVYGADRLVYGAAVISRSLGVPPLIIGMTIVGIGTSLPELIVSVTAALNGQIDMAVGNVLGSNITNILLILGVAALIHPLAARSQVLRRELPLMLAVTVLCGFVLMDSHLSRLDGIILLAAAAGFIMLMLKIARLAQREGNDSLTVEQIAELPQDSSNTVAMLWLLLAFIILPLSSRMIVDNATAIAHYFGLSELVVGLTIIAVGTSLPELATSIAGALKGEDDMAIGNIIGSNIFNSVIVLGVPALLSPGSINPAAYQRDYWVMLAVSVVLSALCIGRKHRIGHLAGALLLCGFIAYLAVLFFNPFSIVGGGQ